MGLALNGVKNDGGRSEGRAEQEARSESGRSLFSLSKASSLSKKPGIGRCNRNDALRWIDEINGRRQGCGGEYTTRANRYAIRTSMPSPATPSLRLGLLAKCSIPLPAS